MAITAKGRATRQRIIEGTAIHLRSADPGTLTLDDVGAVTGTSRGQLFHYFPGGKEELLLAVAGFESDRVLADQQPHLGALTSWSAWHRWRDVVVARYRAQGANCPLGTLLAQVRTTPGAAQVVATLLAQWEGHVRRGIESMQENGLVSPEIEAAGAAAALVAGIQGGVLVLQSTGSSRHLEAAMDLAIEHLRSIPSTQG